MAAFYRRVRGEGVGRAIMLVPMGKDLVRIANGQGFWGDSVDAPARLVREGPIDYLTLDYLAEVTMSIMQKKKRRDPKSGYAEDFVSLIAEIAAEIREKGIRVVASAGGVNPQGCLDALRAVITDADVKGLKIGSVSGDDIFGRLDEILASGEKLANMDDGRSLSEIRDRVLSANVYLSSFPIAEALDGGAAIVVAGRATDPGLVVGPLIHEFGWPADDWNRLAAGTVAGHILECGAQSTGGNFSRWWEVEGWDHLGYPIAEVKPDGSFVVTKHPGTGGLVTVDTISEQLVYEMGDPAAYITPDVIAQFTSIHLSQEGKDRVAVGGILGGPATDTYKVSISYFDGYAATGQLTVSGPSAREKARVAADALWGRLKRAGYKYEKTLTEIVGDGVCHGPAAKPSTDPPEVILRVGVRDPDRAKVHRFGKEIAPLVTSGPPGITGFAGGRPKAREVISFWPALIRKDLVRPEVRVESV
ncbi:MAG TPA: acyclic terpene utilization AtuA family protein [Candidatus Saccharimonadales bacterium]|nr:acyclic terpene utilization AtuA family protein [Candidatus Saccharimonadales bacterium]